VNKKKGDGGSADVEEEEAMATAKDDQREGKMKEVFC
jgi:hypothetical protein